MHPIEALNKNPFVLAPMAGITDHAFRTFMKRRGASVVITELVSSKGIEHHSQRTIDLMSFDSTQHPVGIQLFGEDPESMTVAAQFAESKGCDFIDINFGCPVPKVVKSGAGSAMMKNLPGMEVLLKKVKSSINIPLTIKIRTGWDANSRNALDVCKLAEDCGISWVAIHGRTRSAGYSGQADWDFISDVKSRVNIPIIGNGDILSASQAVKRLKESGCDGVMIGRGALKDPFIFMDAVQILKSEPLRKDLNRDYVSLFTELRQCIDENCSEHITNIQLKKFASWFSTGYSGASQFRKTIFQTKSNDEVMDLAVEFFRSIESLKQEDTSHEPFLMGGHG